VGPAEQEISDLIEDGLHEQNLSRLATICEGLSAQSPTLYVTLSLVFRALALEYDGQGVRPSAASRSIPVFSGPF